MATAATFNDLATYLATEWAAMHPSVPMKFENEKFPTANSPAAFVYVEIVGSSFAQESIGAPGQNLWLETGMILAHVLVTNNSGSTLARTYAGDIADFFREVEVSGIRFREISIGAGEPGQSDGNYWRMTVTIDWEKYEG